MDCFYVQMYRFVQRIYDELEEKVAAKGSISKRYDEMEEKVAAKESIRKRPRSAQRPKSLMMNCIFSN